MLLQVKAEAKIAFDSILQRQALLDKARQEQQLAIRFTSVLGFSARLRAFCQSRQYSQILPAYEQASALIQSQIQAVPGSKVDWGVLQTLMNQVSCTSLLCKPAWCTYPGICTADDSDLPFPSWNVVLCVVSLHTTIAMPSHRLVWGSSVAIW